MNLLTNILLIIGLIFVALATIGLHRFNTVYTRIHASTLSTTFGSIFLVLAIIVYSINNYQTGMQGIISQTFIIHSLVALIAILLTNPVSSHAVARAAHKAGYEVKGPKDDLSKEEKK